MSSVYRVGVDRHRKRRKVNESTKDPLTSRGSITLLPAQLDHDPKSALLSQKKRLPINPATNNSWHCYLLAPFKGTPCPVCGDLYCSDVTCRFPCATLRLLTQCPQTGSDADCGGKPRLPVTFSHLLCNLCEPCSVAQEQIMGQKVKPMKSKIFVWEMRKGGLSSFCQEGHSWGGGCLPDGSFSHCIIHHSVPNHHDSVWISIICSLWLGINWVRGVHVNQPLL